MFTLLIQNGDGTAQRHELRQGITTVGREAGNHIVLADASVSTRHAEVAVENGQTLLRDLNSSSGTTVNGKPVAEIALANGDEVGFGSVSGRVEAVTATESRAKIDAAAAAPKEKSPPQNTEFQPTQQQKARSYLQRLVEAGRSSTFVTDFRDLDFKAEVLPLNEHTLKLLKSDFVFWTVSLLAVVPLILVTLTQTSAQLTGFCLFFAAIWGLIFKKFIVEDSGSWKAPLGALLFTGLVGMNLLLLLYRSLPPAYMALSDSEDSLHRLIGFVFQVGVWEELCKILPVGIYLVSKKKEAKPLPLILVGVFSGLGFAAFENLAYAGKAIHLSEELTRQAGRAGLHTGVQMAMINVMLRSISAVFGHAVYSGIFSYFIALGWVTGKRRVALALVGLGVAALIHGLYDWFITVQDTLPALVTAFGFVLFYAYLTKLRLLMASTTASTPNTPMALVETPVQTV